MHALSTLKHLVMWLSRPACVMLFGRCANRWAARSSGHTGDLPRHSVILVDKIEYPTDRGNHRLILPKNQTRVESINLEANNMDAPL